MPTAQNLRRRTWSSSSAIPASISSELLSAIRLESIRTRSRSKLSARAGSQIRERSKLSKDLIQESIEICARWARTGSRWSSTSSRSASSGRYSGRSTGTTTAAWRSWSWGRCSGRSASSPAPSSLTRWLGRLTPTATGSWSSRSSSRWWRQSCYRRGRRTRRSSYGGCSGCSTGMGTGTSPRPSSPTPWPSSAMRSPSRSSPGWSARPTPTATGGSISPSSPRPSPPLPLTTPGREVAGVFFFSGECVSFRIGSALMSALRIGKVLMQREGQRLDLWSIMCCVHKGSFFLVQLAIVQAKMMKDGIINGGKLDEWNIYIFSLFVTFYCLVLDDVCLVAWLWGLRKEGIYGVKE